MRFINPKTDYAFKRIFGSEQSKDILLSFLNAILYEDQAVIQDLEILNPYSPGANFSLKDTYLDVKAKLDNNTTVLIEMQVLNRYAFDKRVIYNAAKSYSNQLDSGEGYSLLNPVIALTIVNFTLFSESSLITHRFLFKDIESNLVFNKEIELVFVELPKFDKSLEQLETTAEKWIYFLQKAPELREKPTTMSQISAIDHALDIANRANLSVDELEDIQKRAFWLTDQEGIALKAKEIGLAEGLEQGRAQGLEQGLEQGRTEGIKAGKLDLIFRIIRRRFGEVSPEIITQISQLTTEQLEQLGEEAAFLTTIEELLNWLSQV
ncbi:MAG: Rpn family recombination-promoting nuclease/putative transposase [Microcystaceae cyanobacterium]